MAGQRQRLFTFLAGLRNEYQPTVPPFPGFAQAAIRSAANSHIDLDPASGGSQDQLVAALARAIADAQCQPRQLGRHRLLCWEHLKSRMAIPAARSAQGCCGTARRAGATLLLLDSSSCPASPRRRRSTGSGGERVSGRRGDVRQRARMLDERLDARCDDEVRRRVKAVEVHQREWVEPTRPLKRTPRLPLSKRRAGGAVLRVVWSTLTSGAGSVLGDLGDHSRESFRAAARRARTSARSRAESATARRSAARRATGGSRRAARRATTRGRAS